MSVVKRFEHWNVVVRDGERPADIIKALQALPEDAKIDLVQHNYGQLYLRFDMATRPYDEETTYEKT